MNKITTIALLCSLMAGCSMDREEVAPTVNSNLAGTTITIPETEWRIVTEAEMLRVYEESGESLGTGEQLEGFAGITSSGKYVVYTKAPRYVDGPETCTLGHEIMHHTFGEYHEE